MQMQKELAEWSKELTEWQQLAFTRLLEGQSFSDIDIDQLTQICKGEVASATAIQKSPQRRTNDQTASSVKLISIGDISGVENLRPRKKLNFGDRNLYLIFGSNGSGKSSYVRLLKAASGKIPVSAIRTNLFEITPTERTCEIKFACNKENFEKKWDLSEGVPIEALQDIDIFDSDSGLLYITKEKGATYSPRTLLIFDELVKVSIAVKQKLQTEKQSLLAPLTITPAEYHGTTTAVLLEKLFDTNDAQLEEKFTWNEEDEKNMAEIDSRLNVANPAENARLLRIQNTQLINILTKIGNVLNAFSAVEFERWQSLVLEFSEKRSIADMSSKAVLQSGQLDGITSASWRAMWEAARKYSTAHAYPQRKFPNVESSAVCVLCQQELDEPAQHRLSKFEEFILSEFETSAAEAEVALNSFIQNIPEIIKEENARTACAAAKLDEEDTEKIVLFWELVAQENEKLRKGEFKPLNRQDFPWIEELEKRIVDIGKRADVLENDAKSFDRSSILASQKELLSRKWAHIQLKNILKEKERLFQLAKLESLIKSADHSNISRKASKTASLLLTQAYIDRFNEELKALGAKKIKVELVLSKTTEGKPMHAVRLLGAIGKDAGSKVEILSEGEKNIVGLAAFLADVLGRPDKMPFVFDDPITSLDHDFEENVAKRLVALSHDRQVVIFTHRLSFFSLIQAESKIDDTDTICIRREPWGAGEPSDIPFFAKKPASALKNLLNDRLSKAKNIFKNTGYDDYYPHARSICIDIRILLERLVEFVLLSDIIARHRREVQTKGKLTSLAKISSRDCELLEKLMSEYSCFAHNQTDELIVDVPDPDKLIEDIEVLIKWHDEYVKRES